MVHLQLDYLWCSFKNEDSSATLRWLFRVSVFLQSEASVWHYKERNIYTGNHFSQVIALLWFPYLKSKRFGWKVVIVLKIPTVRQRGRQSLELKGMDSNSNTTTSCVTRSELFNLFYFQFRHLWNEFNRNIHFCRFLIRISNSVFKLLGNS